MTSKQSTLTNNALKRIRALAKGNNIAPESIQLVETKEEIYKVSGFLQLTARSSHRSREKLGRIKVKGAQELPSFEALNHEVQRIEREAQEGASFIEPALAELEKLPGHGWGHRDSHLSWSDHETILVAHQNCPECNGAGFTHCFDCQGEGSIPCHYCHGLGHEPCQYCMGSGRDQSNPQNPCATCHGTGQQECRFCFGKKRLECKSCHSRGQIKCTACKGSGVISREARVRSGADMSFSLQTTHGLPSGLLRAMTRLGEENIHKGHAKIQMHRPDPEATSEAEKSRISLEAFIPYAEAKIRFGDKGSLISCFGKKGKLSGVPAFLDEALKASRSHLKRAAKGKTNIEKALKPRLMKEALKLNLSNKVHPNFLRRLYPVGLTGDAASEIMKHMGAALKCETMKVRTIVALACTLLSIGSFAGIFLSPFYRWALDHYGEKTVLIGEITLPLIALSITWFALHSLARSVLKARFPSANVIASPKLGGRGYTALITILLSYVAILGYTKMMMNGSL